MASAKRPSRPNRKPLSCSPQTRVNGKLRQRDAQPFVGQQQHDQQPERRVQHQLFEAHHALAPHQVDAADAQPVGMRQGLGRRASARRVRRSRRSPHSSSASTAVASATHAQRAQQRPQVADSRAIPRSPAAAPPRPAAHRRVPPAGCVSMVSPGVMANIIAPSICTIVPSGAVLRASPPGRRRDAARRRCAAWPRRHAGRAAMPNRLAAQRGDDAVHDADLRPGGCTAAARRRLSAACAGRRTDSASPDQQHQHAAQHAAARSPARHDRRPTTAFECRASLPNGAAHQGRTRRRLHRQAARAPGQEQLAARPVRGAPQAKGSARTPLMQARSAPLQRAQALPLQPVDRVAGGMALRDRAAAQAPAGLRVMAVGAGQVELADALTEKRAAALARRVQPRILRRRQRQAARLQGDIGLQAERACSRRAAQRRGCSLLPARARCAGAGRPAAAARCRRPGSAPPRRASTRAHRHGSWRRSGRVAPVGAVPQLLAFLHPQHARVERIVALHRLRAGLMNSKPERRPSTSGSALHAAPAARTASASQPHRAASCDGDRALLAVHETVVAFPD